MSSNGARAEEGAAPGAKSWVHGLHSPVTGSSVCASTAPASYHFDIHEAVLGGIGCSENFRAYSGTRASVTRLPVVFVRSSTGATSRASTLLLVVDVRFRFHIGVLSLSGPSASTTSHGALRGVRLPQSEVTLTHTRFQRECGHEPSSALSSSVNQCFVATSPFWIVAARIDTFATSHPVLVAWSATSFVFSGADGHALPTAGVVGLHVEKPRLKVSPEGWANVEEGIFISIWFHVPRLSTTRTVAPLGRASLKEAFRVAITPFAESP